MTAKFEIFKDTESSRYWFRLKAANGEVVAESQVYHSISDARRGMAAVRNAADAASIPDSDDVVKVQSGNYIHMHYKQQPT